MSRPLSLLEVVDLGLACCALEADEALRRLGVAPAAGRVSAPETVVGAEPEPAGRRGVLVVAGTVTDVLAPLVRARYQAMSPPPWVVSFGACSATGGPYWDAYSVTPGIGELIPVDVYVPGCPPRPEALADAVAQLLDGAGQAGAPG
jgi:NADH-quinone oxidoreductase subunit B